MSTSEPITIPLSTVRKHLADAFTLLAAEHDRQHLTALHLSAISGQGADAMFRAVASQAGEARDSFQLLEKFLWAAVGDLPALAVVGPMIDAARAKVR